MIVILTALFTPSLSLHSAQNMLTMEADESDDDEVDQSASQANAIVTKFTRNNEADRFDFVTMLQKLQETELLEVTKRESIQKEMSLQSEKNLLPEGTMSLCVFGCFWTAHFSLFC